jgi:hypothetical protein
MVIYDLACGDGHRFEGWFQDLGAFKAQASARQLACPTCGSADVEKLVTGSAVRRTAEDRAGTTTLPAAAVATTEKAATPSPAAEQPATPTAMQVREFLGTLAAQIRAHSEDVGPRFAEEARKIHHGQTEDRLIRGTTTEAEEQALADDEIPFLKLPVFNADD